jgi:hypothetical protein
MRSGPNLAAAYEAPPMRIAPLPMREPPALRAAIARCFAASRTFVMSCIPLRPQSGAQPNL